MSDLRGNDSGTAEGVVELAQRLRSADPQGWTAQGTRALVAALGWEWSEPGDGDDEVPVRTGRETGDARLRPGDKYAERYVGSEEFIELAVPLTAPLTGTAAQVGAFAEARRQLVQALGPAPVAGSYGSLGPIYGRTVSWGAPFLRWRGEENSLELRAGQGGPELVLQPTDPIENWFWRSGVGEEFSIEGYFGADRSPANGGLGFPGRWYAQSWQTVTSALGEFLDSLAAELTALGLTVSMPLYGRAGDNGAPLLFDITYREDRLVVGCFLPDGTEHADGSGAVDARELGWGTVADHPETAEVCSDDEEPRWRIDGGGPDEASGRAIAAVMVATARAIGVAEPSDLILGGEGESVGRYDMTFYGLGLRTG
ncbi:hypothetical protein [Yinghuangia soli]|uniref:Uncharacterized protein n=1 Tax=Yinghuangia soli TaxID=2908204 RepID=A0AA41Q4X3_9ACTN|nr:hypothetical protein [Yinghuangia soli]MCF2531619.1 hypothetical protein [Yinghuangia soli]